ncbi:MAG: alpha-2-macroglobulin family protein, partial [Azoarcus sp.]|nr:alpha-2-macroglobulin family protein [Azoarcus sp.]
KPGDTVTVDIDASLKGQPARAMLTVSVVDEAIYAQQPEIAPDVVEFFQHVRRNNVRTDASLNFITYDEAADYASDAARQPPARHQYNERGIKVLERARRDDTDTAAWQPTLVTDASGHARFSFKMPDALSRWRITVRAVALDGAAASGGAYGQRTAHVQSDKPLYAKWTSPAWMREGDAPVASLAVFNNMDATREAAIVLKLAGEEITQKATLARGINYLPFKLPSFTGAQTARLEVRDAGTLADALETPLEAKSSRWRGVREQAVELDRGATPLKLPASARRLSLRLAASGSEHFLRIADSLIDYPWGCVEQTSSRLIPLAIVTPLLAPDRTRGDTAPLWQALSSQRQRLAAMAGPNAVFGWWGRGTGGDLLMSAYAYYADWHAARALGISLPTEHWENVLTVYRDHADKTPVLHRALALWFIQQIGLPTRTQAEGLVAALRQETDDKNGNKDEDGIATSPLLSAPDSPLGLAYARTLTAIVASEAGIRANFDTPSEARTEANTKPGKTTKSRSRTRAKSRPAQPAASGNALARAKKALQDTELPSARALLLLAGNLKPDEAPAILAAATEETPTLDRALTLVWTRKALGGGFRHDAGNLKPADDKWTDTETRFGQTEWRWPTGARLPDTLRVSHAPARLTAILRFESEESGDSTLPVKIERKLYRLERRTFKKGNASYAALPVKPGDKLSTQELYLDEIRLSASNVYRYGIVEAPLPPGAAIERSTWGIALLEDDGKEGKTLDSSRAEEHPDRYGIPVEILPAGQEVILRNLLRVGQSGSFTLPPVRYHRMYQPEKKAYAEGGNAVWVVN